MAGTARRGVSRSAHEQQAAVQPERPPSHPTEPGRVTGKSHCSGLPQRTREIPANAPTRCLCSIELRTTGQSHEDLAPDRSSVESSPATIDTGAHQGSGSILQAGRLSLGTAVLWICQERAHHAVWIPVPRLGDPHQGCDQVHRKGTGPS